MSYLFTVSPDFNPSKISSWFIFNTWLQRHLGMGIHLELFNDFPEQHQAIQDDKVDLIYANPYDTTMLVREKGFVPVARPMDKQDEGLIVVRNDHPAQKVEDLQPGTRIATTLDPDVNMICMIMLEPADLNRDNIALNTKANYLLVAKEVLKGDADAGFILQESFDEFSSVLHSSLRPLVTSAIRDIYHTLLLGPRMAEHQEDIQTLLINMADDPKGPGVLDGLGFQGWEAVAEEDMEFMIDLMDTLES